jgi:squalene-hopene/tetraprenyl-beta-curcumene cyclase
MMRSTDLMNTTHALEAIRVTQDVEDLRVQGKRVDVNWETALKYIGQMQNKPEAGENEAGGFFYKPGKSMAGTTNTPSGVVVFRSYGSMTYIGLLALIYSNVPKDDPRILSAFDWACRHWSLDENPGLGQEGMYFFYHVLTKSLTTFGRPLIPLKDGSAVNWRVEVARRILALQKTDPSSARKYWANETGRYWESDPVLVTCYMVQALEQILPPETAPAR